MAARSTKSSQDKALDTTIAHCGWKVCKQKKIVLIQRDDVLGVDRGICAKHKQHAEQMARWETIQEFKEYG